MEPWLWASMVVLAALAEIFITDMTGFGLAFGALMAAGASMLGFDWPVQLVAASLGVLVFVYILRPLVGPGRRKKTTVLSHDLVGVEGWLIRGIEPGMPGSVKVRGEIWAATADVPIPPETPVVITHVDGATLTVIVK